MFFKKLKPSILDIEADRVRILHLTEQVDDQRKKIMDLQHEVLKLDGHIKSLRGSFNQFKFRNNPDPEESEDIKTSKPTDVLRGL